MDWFWFKPPRFSNKIPDLAKAAEVTGTQFAATIDAVNTLVENKRVWPFPVLILAYCVSLLLMSLVWVPADFRHYVGVPGGLVFFFSTVAAWFYFRGSFWHDYAVKAFLRIENRKYEGNSLTFDYHSPWFPWTSGLTVTAPETHLSSLVDSDDQELPVVEEKSLLAN